MRSTLVALPLALLAGCSTTPAASPASRTPTAAEPLGIHETLNGLRGPDCGPHLARAMEIAADPRFASEEPTEDQVLLLWQITVCAADREEYEIAFRHADRATNLDPEIGWLQVVRLHLGVSFDQPDASLDALQVLSRMSPESVREIELRHLGRLLGAARDADSTGDRALEAYEAIARAQYVPAAPYFDDFLRMGHARLLLERRRVEEARALLTNIVDIESVVEMRVDRLFDPLRTDPAFESQLELAQAAKRDVARSRTAMEANPGLMEAVYLHAGVLDTALRDAEGLAVTEAALARHEANHDAFSDADEFRNWVINKRGDFLYGVGRADDGRAALGEAAGMPERGDANVSNIINLGGYLVAEGRAAEALELIPRIGEASPYGKAWIEAIRSCAGVQLNDEELRTRGLDYLEAHEADNPSAYSRALLCSNDLDGAAALMIRRLSDRKTRTEALLALQVSPASGEAELPFITLMQERFSALRARADVRATAEKIGRIETIPVSVSAVY